MDELLKANTATELESHPWRAVKLLLHKDEIDNTIRELEEGIRSLGTLQSLVEQCKWPAPGGVPTSSKAKQLAKSLRRIRTHANRLHSAISQAWSPTCPERHQTKLFLDPRVGPRQPLPVVARQPCQPIKYEVVITCAAYTLPNVAWHDHNVEVLEDDDGDDIDQASASMTGMAPGKRGVQFVNVPEVSLKQQAFQLNDLVNLCEMIHDSMLKQKFLRLYLQQAKIGFRHAENACQSRDLRGRSVSLAELLSSGGLRADRSRRIPLKDRMSLALCLSSNILQLQNTPWISQTWSKDRVMFMCKEGCETNPNSISAADFDTSKPFILRTFSTPQEPFPAPKKALQEFAIILLELWHENSLESRFSLTAVPSPAERLYHALDWIDDEMNPPPDNYRQAVSQCLQPHFSTVNGILSWDDLHFQQAVCQFVITPLLKTCELWSR